VWRVFEFISRATSHELITSPVQAYKAARAFGHFQSLLADYDGPRLHETIPRFHDTVKRYEDFAAVVDADPLGRLGEVREEVDWLLGRRELAGSMLRLAAEGVLPERITHNDTKLSNVLLDDVTGEAMCVVDLDTVMPGLSLYDFADLCRSGATTVAEDAPDASGLDVDVPMFQALAEGYLAGAGSALLPAERGLLVLAGEVMTLEQAYRFLGDHLAGDTYYQEIYATAHGVYQASVNGTEVDDQILKPGWTTYQSRLVHETTDVTGLLVAGKNALGVALNGGWYTEIFGFRENASPFYGEQPAFAGQLLLEYADGTTAWVATGPDWSAYADGPFVESGIYLGERYDARLLPVGGRRLVPPQTVGLLRASCRPGPSPRLVHRLRSA
jgi:hypothetical protein